MGRMVIFDDDKHFTTGNHQRLYTSVEPKAMRRCLCNWQFASASAATEDKEVEVKEVGIGAVGAKHWLDPSATIAQKGTPMRKLLREA